VKAKKRVWKITLIVVNDISWMGKRRGTLTKLVTGWRIKDIIRDEIDSWRDLKVKKIKAKKARTA
jgi:hypothetical protein